MTIFEAIILGIVQGLTEFLPISSSGHLVIFETWFALDAEKLRSFDVVLHVGTLLAIFMYFRKDFIRIIRDMLSGRFRMAVLLVLGTIPAVIVGFLLSDLLDETFRDARMVAYTLIIFSLLFFIAERFPREKKYALAEINIKHPFRDFFVAMFIGVMQALALIPGVSRSGATISAGLLMGMKREEAARFSFILGSIAILGAAVLTGKDVVEGALSLPPPTVFLSGLIASVVSGYLTIAFLMKFLRTHTLYAFAFYRIFIGVIALLFLN